MSDVLTVNVWSGTHEEASIACHETLDAVLGWLIDDGWQEWQIVDLVSDRIETLREER